MIHKLKIFILILLSLLFSAVELPNSDISDWTIMTDNDVWVGYKNHKGFPWCRSISILPYSIDQIIPIVGDFSLYSKVFTRINESKIIDTKVVYLKLDLPLFFSDRDYVVQYTSFEENNNIVYQWKSVKRVDVPIYEGVVRLHNAAGEWRLTPIGENLTKVSYTWNGQLLGDFPSFYLSQAWKTQGLEIIDWLEDALDK